MIILNCDLFANDLRVYSRLLCVGREKKSLVHTVSPPLHKSLGMRQERMSVSV